MSGATHDDQLLRSYLLGSLAPELLESVDKRLFSDDRIFWEHLCLVEDELIDDYVNGTLTQQETELFERTFVSNDERRGKIEFARALRVYADTEPAVRERDDERREEAATRRFAMGQRISVPAWAVAAAAATLLLFLPIATWEFGGSRSSPDDATAWLSSGVVRDVGGEVQKVRIRSGSKLVRLRLARDSNDYAAFRATLYEAEGGEIWSVSNLQAAITEGRTAVTLTLPAEFLRDGDYFVKLSGRSAGADFVALNRYDFRVTREQTIAKEAGRR